jgi:hypothetical protein
MSVGAFFHKISPSLLVESMSIVSSNPTATNDNTRQQFFKNRMKQAADNTITTASQNTTTTIAPETTTNTDAENNSNDATKSISILSCGEEEEEEVEKEKEEKVNDKPNSFKFIYNKTIENSSKQVKIEEERDYQRQSVKNNEIKSLICYTDGSATSFVKLQNETSNESEINNPSNELESTTDDDYINTNNITKIKINNHNNNSENNNKSLLTYNSKRTYINDKIMAICSANCSSKYVLYISL